jgi:hypothetical protein
VAVKEFAAFAPWAWEGLGGRFGAGDGVDEGEGGGHGLLDFTAAEEFVVRELLAQLGKEAEEGGDVVPFLPW